MPIAEILASTPLMLVALFGVLLIVQALNPGLWLLSLTAGYTVAVLWVVLPVVRWSRKTLTVTNRRVILEHGLISRVQFAIPFGAIQHVEVRRSLLGWLLRYGTVDIGTGTGSTVSFGRVPLEGLQEQLQRGIPPQDGISGPPPPEATWRQAN